MTVAIATPVVDRRALHDRVDVLVGDCRETLRSLPDNSVHCVVTSPPYLGLRDYGADGQIGLESSISEWLEALMLVFDEVHRVLRPDGTLWLNIGDAYANGTQARRKASVTTDNGSWSRESNSVRRSPEGLAAKQLLMLPARLALALQARGWWLRAEIQWHKPNALPETVTDRPCRDHEQVYLLSKSPRYFYDTFAVRLPASVNTHDRGQSTPPKTRAASTGTRNNGSFINAIRGRVSTRNLRTVWRIPTVPTTGSHFATFPPALVEVCLRAGTSEHGCCPMCGAPWKREVRSHFDHRGTWNPDRDRKFAMSRGRAINTMAKGDNFYEVPAPTHVGWKLTCSCNAGDPVPCTVLDPFGGSGTTGAVALQMGRRAILCELNADYVPLMEQRIADAQKPRAARRARKATAAPSQGELHLLAGG